MKKKVLILFASLVVLVIMAGIGCILLYNGVLHVNNPSKSKYPIRGVDVSHYQGEVDWQQLSKEGIRFAYIKATEGSSHKDEQFDQNWKNAQATDLRIGAYHFFSLDSSGIGQAQNFCETVAPVENMMPPVVDVEPYGGYRDPNTLDKEKMLTELGNYMDGIEACYSTKPVIYTTEEWLPVIQEQFADYDVWIRDVYGKPDASIQWTLWQFSNRHVLKGYSGAERYIDMNVFYGNEEEFNQYH